MNESEIRATVAAFESPETGQREAAWKKLRPLDADVIPFLNEGYSVMRKWIGRVALVVYATPFARDHEEAFRLGVLALSDRATLVRYRACALLAYSLREDALPHLKAMLEHEDGRTVEDAAAAIEAIRSQNHHLFVDRDRTGRIFWHGTSDAA